MFAVTDPNMKTREQDVQEQMELAKRVMHGVADFTGVTLEEMVSSSRKAKIMEARHLSMYFVRSKTDLKLAHIAKLLNKKSHVPVLHGLNKVRAMSSNERAFSQRLAKLKLSLDSIKLHKS